MTDNTISRLPRVQRMLRSQQGMCALDKAVAYDDCRVPERFADLYSVGDELADELFTETKKWLWLCAFATKEREQGIRGAPDRMVIDTPLLILDEMWHNFLCFTESYHWFCSDVIGAFVHHSPASRTEREKQQNECHADPASVLRKKRAQCEYIHSILGEDTLRRWYLDYGKRFTPECLRALRLG